MTAEQLTQAQTFRDEGLSYRVISERLNVPLASLHRALAESDEELERSRSLLEPLDALLQQTAAALDSDDPAAITATLAEVEKAETAASNALEVARATTAEAEDRVSNAAAHVAMARDAVDRAQAEKALAEAKAEFTATQAVVPLHERAYNEIRPLADRLRKRWRALALAEAEHEVENQLETVQQQLERAKHIFLRELQEIQAILPSIKANAEAAGLTALAERAVLANPFQRIPILVSEIEGLNIGPLSIDGQARVRVTLKRYWRGHERGDVMTTSMRDAIDLWRDGVIETPVFQPAGR